MTEGLNKHMQYLVCSPLPVFVCLGKGGGVYITDQPYKIGLKGLDRILVFVRNKENANVNTPNGFLSGSMNVIWYDPSTQSLSSALDEVVLLLTNIPKAIPIVNTIYLEYLKASQIMQNSSGLGANVSAVSAAHCQEQR